LVNSIAQNFQGLIDITELERLEALLEDQNSENFNYENWELAFASVLCSGLPINHLDQRVLIKL
jgi:hypothetical protein